MSVGVKKRMICVDCLMEIVGTIVQAKVNGWELWVGGARCKSCKERAPAPRSTQPKAK